MLRIEEHCRRLERTLPFFEKKPPQFKEGFCLIFGSDIRDRSDILLLVEDFRKLMWKKSKNGKRITKGEIYSLRGKSVVLLRSSGNHHWPPQPEKSSIKIIMPIDFHKGWHLTNFGLWRRKDLREFWKNITAECYENYFDIERKSIYIMIKNRAA